MADPSADPKNPMRFTQTPQQVLQPQASPYVHPAVAASPEALAYQAGLQARRGGLPKYNVPVPGPGPAMPPLDREHVPGLTIEQQAAMHGPSAGQMASAHAGRAGSIVEGPRPTTLESPRPNAPVSPPTPAQLGLLNTDMLPPLATQDRNYIQGQGAQFAVNQPALALKYGVMRGSQHIPPGVLQGNNGPPEGGRVGNRALDNTLQDLQRIANAQPPKGMPETEEEAVKQVTEQSAAGAAQNAGNLPAEDKERALQDALQSMDDFDFDALRRQMQRDILNNPEQREIIEGRLEPLNIDELIMHDRISQVVPIVPGKFWIELESLTMEDDLELKRLLMLQSKTAEVTQRYLLDKFAVMSAAASVKAICNNPVPSHLDQNGQFNETLFWQKFFWLLRRPVHMIAVIGVNCTWFEMRVRRLFVAEKVKNG